MRLALLLSALVAIAGCTREQAPEIPEGPVAWSVSASTTTPEVQVGDDFTLTLTLTHPPEGDFVPPPEADFEPFDVLETWTETVSPVETKLHFRLAAFQLPEDLEVAPLSIQYRDDAGEMARVETEPVAVRVVTSLTAEVTDIHDIKDPMALEVPRDWSLLAWLLLAVLVSLVAYIIYRRLRKDTKDEAAPAWVPPPRPPHEEAEAALARLAEKGLIEKGEVALFYTELTDIMKRYAGRRFEVPYLERTTEEVLSDLAAKHVSAPRLGAILEIADLVKFAKQMPGQQQGRSSLTMALDLVRDTRAAPMEATAMEATSMEATS
ncbi:MAG: hypothetical protein BMS9Abin37_1613 [Acidobacteriota bacterium]|nr:MAG: hypothetical protein BMS9Abin37_1613 [Acidobacteriota bacterium]